MVSDFFLLLKERKSIKEKVVKKNTFVGKRSDVSANRFTFHVVLV